MAEETKEIALSEVKDGLVRIALIYTGEKFKKDNQEFTVSGKDLREIQKNLNEREVMIDYEHYSAQAVPPGWSKAAGWIKRADSIEQLSDGREVLYGWAEFTPVMLSLIANKEYRYFSAEPHWNSRDEHGKNRGTALGASAMTNRPFQKSLPPIEIDPTVYPQLLEAVALSESKRLLVDINAVHVAAEINSEKEKKAMAAKKLTFKKLSDGDDKGKIGIFSDSEMVGMCDRAAMKAYMAEDPDDDEGGKDTPVKLKEAAVAVCFSELAKAKDGKEVVALTDRFVDEGKFETRELRRAQKIEALVSEGIAKAKILPKQRAAFFSMAIADYDSAVAFLAEQKPVVDTTSHGIEGDGGGGPDAKQELETRVVAYMKEKTVDRIVALREVARIDPALWERSKNQQPTASDRE